jgi:DNA replication protein DnaC
MNNENIKKQLHYLRLEWLKDNWDNLLQESKKKQPSYHKFLTDIIEKEYQAGKEKARYARINRAQIPEKFVMATFPFEKQPRLKKKMVMELYDSMQFIKENQDMVFIGPTGSGKTGLATSFLIHAINQGYRGYFTDFQKLMRLLFQSRGDHTEQKVLKQLQSYDILLIDELGYITCNKEQAGLFFDLMRRRHKRNTTLITTQLGFNEWSNFLQDVHLTAALLDRITENCAVFNMKECISIRPKKIVYATKSENS